MLAQRQFSNFFAQEMFKCFRSSQSFVDDCNHIWWLKHILSLYTCVCPLPSYEEGRANAQLYFITLWYWREIFFSAWWTTIWLWYEIHQISLKRMVLFLVLWYVYRCKVHATFLICKHNPCLIDLHQKIGRKPNLKKISKPVCKRKHI